MILRKIIVSLDMKVPLNTGGLARKNDISIDCNLSKWAYRFSNNEELIYILNAFINMLIWASTLTSRLITPWGVIFSLQGQIVLFIYLSKNKCPSLSGLHYWLFIYCFQFPTVLLLRVNQARMRWSKRSLLHRILVLRGADDIQLICYFALLSFRSGSGSVMQP